MFTDEERQALLEMIRQGKEVLSKRANEVDEEERRMRREIIDEYYSKSLEETTNLDHRKYTAYLNNTKAYKELDEFIAMLKDNPDKFITNGALAKALELIKAVTY